MQENHNPSGKIGSVLYLKDQFSTNRQFEEPIETGTSESDRFNKRRHGVTFVKSELSYPNVSPNVYLQLAHRQVSDEEVINTAHTFFDSQNSQLIEKSQGGLNVLQLHDEHLARRQISISTLLEELLPIRVLFSNIDLVKPSNISIIALSISILIVVGLLVIEWCNQAVLVQMSGDQAFLGDGGFLKALLVTPVLIMFTLFMKVFISDFSIKNQRMIINYVVFIVTALALIYFFTFANFYGWVMNEESLEMPPDIYKKLMIFMQLTIAPFVVPFIFNKVGKQAIHYKEDVVFHNNEYLALDEELSSIVARRKDNAQIINHIKGFSSLYQAERKRYAEEFFGNYMDFKIVFLSETNSALVRVINSAVKKPTLKILKGG